MGQASLVIRNGRIVDGTGSAGYAGDLAITDGKIVAVGAYTGTGLTEIDAGGMVVAPGFIDIHTHYDPQICWDKLATPSLEHGVTTVVMGNCSLSLAPVRPNQKTKLIRMFEKIEDIKEATFDAAVAFDWETFGDYLEKIRPGLGINVGALVGHSAIRYYVMGTDSQERIATDDEIAQMCAIMEGAMAAGALGLSTSYVDIDEDGRPVPSRLADMREKIALCHAMAKSGRGVLQTVPYFIDIEQQLANIEELGDISLATGVVCSIAPITYNPTAPENWSRSLAKLEDQQKRGAKVFGQSMPRSFDINIILSETSFLLYPVRKWDMLMKLPLAERIVAFADPVARPVLVESAERRIMPLLKNMAVGRVYAPENQQYLGRKLPEIALATGKSVADIMLDIAVADGLRTEFQIRGAIHADPEIVSIILDHPLIHIGGSDAGAHVTQFCGAGDTCDMLERYVRGYGKMSVERAVHRMTGEPAKAWGVRGRGTLETGQAADVVIFDPATIARGEEIFVNDFPGGASRYVRHATGIDKVIVNGAVVLDRGQYTEARTGEIV
jgi:N-acyl-D-amino-acid deacylase